MNTFYGSKTKKTILIVAVVLCLVIGLVVTLAICNSDSSNDNDNRFESSQSSSNHKDNNSSDSSQGGTQGEQGGMEGGQGDEQGGTEGGQGDGQGDEQNKKGKLSYSVNEDGTTCTVTGIETCTDTDLNIPNSIDGYTVTGIKNYAFEDCTSLTSVTIPDSVTTIGYRAFDDCSELTSVYYSGTIDQWVQIDFDDYASNPLYYAKNLYIDNTIVTKANITTVTKINGYAFYGYKSLTSITIGNSVTSIGNYAFYGCTALTEINYNATNCADLSYNSNSVFSYAGQSGIGIEVTIGKNVKNIPDYLFYSSNSSYSPKITSFVFEQGSVCESIGYYAFYNCRSLTTLTIPDGVTSIGYMAFYNCTALTEINFNATNYPDLSYDDYVFYNAGQSGVGIKVTIGKNVKNIPANLFDTSNSDSSYSPKVTSVVFEDGSVCESIGYYAFYNCKSLTTLTIPDGVTSIGYMAFYGCYKLVEVINKSSLNITKSSTDNGYVAYYALNVKNEGTSDIVNVNDYLFYTYDNVNYLLGYVGSDTDLVLPENYKERGYKIYQYAFYNSSKTTSITIPYSVTSIGNYAFYNCKALTKLNYNATNCADLSDSNYVFSYAGQSRNGIAVTIGKNVKNIPAYLFYPYYYYSSYSPNIASVVFDEGSICENIGSAAFENCSSLTSITIPESVTSIGNYAFGGCHKLVEVINKSSLNITKGASDNGYVAYNALNVKNEGSSDIVNVNDYLFYTYDNVNYLLGYVGSDTNLVLPDTYNGQNYDIYKFALSNCKALQYNKYDNAYYLGTKNNPYFVLIKATDNLITSCIINKNTKFIHSDAFYHCFLLTSVTIPDNVTSIGRDAFYNCNKLTSVTISKSVTSIEDSAFYSCSSLKSVYYNGTIDQWVQIEFGNEFTNPLHYAKNLYIDNKLVTEVNITTASKINAYAFEDCTSLTSVTIGNNVTSIERDAFEGCKALTSITIPENVTSIGSSAFSNCTSLTSITIGNSVSSIGDFAFYYCTSLTKVYYKGNTDEWSNISIGSYNYTLTDVTRYYYSEKQPTDTSGNYWHYDKGGNVVEW